MSFAPLVATITGSTTFFTRGAARSRSATTSIASGVASMPVLSARTLYISKTASSWSAMNAAGTSRTLRTPRGFCAVSAANTVQPCSP